jgi:uncharacterized membrane protein YphA (DoxX/SURF4 family)
MRRDNMGEFHLFLREFIGVIFITAGFMKILKKEEHSIILHEYKILPTSWVNSFFWIEVILELFAGILLFIDLFGNIASIIIACLVIVYIIAISTNLLRGRNEISCGCGGISGTHQLSWYLVIRNFILFISVIYLYINKGTIGSLQAILSGSYIWDVFNLKFIITTFYSAVFIFVSMSITEIFKLKNRIKVLLNQN